MGVGSVVGGDLSVAESSAAGSVTPVEICFGAGWLDGGEATRTSWVGGGATTSAADGAAGELLDGPVMATSRGALHKGDTMRVRAM